jgi:hypothetical protein
LNCMAINDKISNGKFFRIQEIFKNQLNKNNIIGQYIRKCKMAQTVHFDLWNNSSLVILVKHMNNYSYYDSNSTKAAEYDYDNFFNDVISCYPMIKFFPMNYYVEASDIEKVNSYVDSIDKLKDQDQYCNVVSMCA